MSLNEGQVIPFGKPGTIAEQPPPPPTEDDSGNTMTPEQAEMLLAVGTAGSQLLEWKDRLRYFVVAVALKEPADNTSFHILTSPMEVAEYFLLAKVIEKHGERNI
jgi:hypothetical protein